MAFVDHFGIQWPKHSRKLLETTVADVMAWGDSLLKKKRSTHDDQTVAYLLSQAFSNTSLRPAGELRLPFNVPNPAHAQFIARSSRDPVRKTKALSPTRARQLMGLPSDETVIHARDRAILKFYLYSAARIATGCRVQVNDFHRGKEEATIRITEKGDKRRTIGIHPTAADAIAEYIEMAGIESAPLFRSQRNSRRPVQGDRGFSSNAMYNLINGYLRQLPGAVRTEKNGTGQVVERCIYWPHSLRATAATLLAGVVDLTKVQQLLGHANITTTQIYDKRRRTTKESASHDLSI